MEIELKDRHLCNLCKFEYPYCDGENIDFGCDFQGASNTQDNIVNCDAYEKKEE